MQTKMCIKCKKNIAVVFISKIENGVTMNEGYCLKCARSLGIPQIDQAVKQMGISEEDLDLLSDEMGNIFGQRESSDDGEDDEIDSQTATFPLLNQLFGGSNMPAQQPRPPKKEEPSHEENKEKKKKSKQQLKNLKAASNAPKNVFIGTRAITRIGLTWLYNPLQRSLLLLVMENTEFMGRSVLDAELLFTYSLGIA